MSKPERSLRQRVANPTYGPLLLTAALAALAASMFAGAEPAPTTATIIATVIAAAVLGLLLPPFDPPDHRTFRLLYPLACAAVALIAAVVWRVAA